MPKYEVILQDGGLYLTPQPLELPWPPKDLSPNSRVHHLRKYKASKKFKSACFLLAKGKRPHLPQTGNVPISIWFHPPSNISRDLDNCFAAFKAGIDGIAEAWGINDKRFHPITISFGEPVNGGKVVVIA